jgi:hypothetical protein
MNHLRRSGPFPAVVAVLAVFATEPALAGNDHVPMSGPINRMDTTKPGVPGPRTCFWTTGPFSGDPYLNIAWPDTNTYYWAAKFTVPEGAKLELQGQYAHARYSSFTTYDMRGQPIESLADYLIEPDPGNINPTRDGADRTVQKRAFTIEVLATGDREKREEGYFVEGATSKVIHAPKNDGYQQVLILRVYTPDRGQSITGGVPLPTPVLTMPDGRVLRGAAACDAINAKQQMKIAPDAVGMPAWRYRELLNSPGKPDTNPATNPSTWYAQFDRKQFEGIFTGEPGNFDRKSEGFYPTVDNQYVRTFINRKFGPVYVLRGKLPRTPKTMDGEPLMKVKGFDMRYWSICSQKGAANTMVLKCLNDEQVVTDKDRNYVIAFSRAADRPRTAYPECGINWLPIPDDGDGLFDADQGNMMIRNQLASPDFPNSIQKVTKTGDERQVMGPYLPNGFYIVQATFEGLFPCNSAAEAARAAEETQKTDSAQLAARAQH